MLSSVLTIAFCLLGPLFVMWLTYKSTFLHRVGDIIITYIIGCAIGLSGLIPPEAQPLLTIAASVSIPFAIPLMLMSSDVRAWRHLAPQFAKSTVAGIGGCIIAITIGFLLFADYDKETCSKVGGMLTGLYTGGTANQASLKIALGIPDDIYLISHTYSIMTSAIYLIFIIIFGQRVLNLILPRFKETAAKEENESKNTIEDHSSELFYGLFRKDNLEQLGKAMLITIGILAVGGLVAWGIQAILKAIGSDSDVFMAVFILSISLITAVAATNNRIREIKRTYEAGTFFILVFSIAVSSQVNTSMLDNVNSNLFAFITTATLGALLMHIAISAIWKIDTDTTLVCSAALICSPPFVPVMAGALNNKAVIGPGIAVGLFGYATGTYIGFLVAQWLAYLI